MTEMPVNSKYVKHLNRAKVLNMVREHEPISRQQLSRVTGLTPPAITGIVRELLDLGFVVEEGLGKSSGGRKPVKLKFNSRAGFVVGLEITQYETTIGLSDLKNNPMEIRTVTLDMINPEDGLRGLSEEINKVIKSRGITERNLMGTGVAFPGLLSAKDGVVKRSVNLGPQWDGFPLKAALEKELGLPVFVENNSNTSVLAERWFGGGRDCRDLVYINLGEGISAGIIIDEHIIQGFQGYAGEIGHMVLIDEGPLCNCGNRGCLESICGVPAVVRRANEELPLLRDDDPLKKIRELRKVSIEDILSNVQVEGSYACHMIQQVGRFIGIAVANVINLYNPQVVFLGGKLAAAGSALIGPLREMVKTHAFPEIAYATRIEISALGGNSGTIGACALALRELFSPTGAAIFEDTPTIDHP